MDEGYLQNKIREQADDIRELKNKVKELEIKTRRNEDDVDVTIGKKFISMDKKIDEIDKDVIDKKIDDKIKKLGGMLKYLFDRLNSQSKNELDNVIKMVTNKINSCNSAIDATLTILVDKKLTTELEFNSIYNDAYADNKNEKFLRYRERCNSTSFTSILKEAMKSDDNSE